MRINSFKANKLFQTQSLLPTNQAVDSEPNKPVVWDEKRIIIENIAERKKLRNTTIIAAVGSSIFMLVLSKGKISLGILGAIIGSLLGYTIGLFRLKLG